MTEKRGPFAKWTHWASATDHGRMDQIVARKMWRTLEPYHGMIYFAEEGRDLDYFAARAAAMGPVPADGHIAALGAAGVGPGEALVVHAATGDVPPAVLQRTRAWPDDEWAAAVSSVQARGWLAADGSLTQPGRAHRDAVEAVTDEA